MNQNNNIFKRTMDWFGAFLKRAFTIFKSSLGISLLFLFAQGSRRVLIWGFEKRKADGSKIFVDKVPGTKNLKAEEKQKNYTDPQPKEPEYVPHPFKARQMRVPEYPKPEFVLKYEEPPLSGKILSGVGETKKRRAKKFYHNGYQHIYGAMELIFVMTTPLKALKAVLKAGWYNNYKDGSVALRKMQIDDPTEITNRIKLLALKSGASSVGCTKVTEETLYESVKSYLPNAISLAAPMERDIMLTIPSKESGAVIIDGYIDVGRAAVKVAEYIRSLGWNAEANTNLMNAKSKVLHIPLAVNAGLGQMGRHTSLITKEHGANVRLAAVLTDMPLVFDEPQDIGVEDVCLNCRICAENCPPKAIYTDKVLVRGVEKYHLDFDRCMPYFNEMDTCGICITVCPWSESGKGDLLSQLQQHRKKVQVAYPAQLPVTERLVSIKKAAQSKITKESTIVEDYWQKAVVTDLINYKGGIIELHISQRDETKILPRWSAGAHIEIKLPSGKIRAYSLSNKCDINNGYRLGIKVEEDGNGGSLEIAALKKDTKIMVKRPGNNFPLNEGHDYYFLIAGGIGITPLVPMAHKLKALNKDFEIHYAVKKENKAIYEEELKNLIGDKLHIHHNRGWIKNIRQKVTENSAIYVCGPSSLMDEVRVKGQKFGISNRSIYSEDFGSTANDKPFDIILASSGERLTIPPGETISKVLDENGIYIPISCGYGICGVCTVGILKGEPDARDRILSKAEKETKITLCCSRSKSKELVIDL